MPLFKLIRGLIVAAAATLLSGCNMVLMSPSGDLAVQQRDLIIWSTVLMLLVIIPVIALTIFVAWRYRDSNDNESTYTPEWEHSTILELICWAIPLAIIVALGALVWVYSHKLDPFRPLERISATKPLAPNTQPLEVDVVSLDWKWLFIYPQQGIATVNEVAAPVDQPITFNITSTTMMNSFFIPALAGQIYSMAGMETQLHAVINKPGVYKGFSANYSGAGFTDMKFKFHGLSNDDFDKWVQKVKSSNQDLSLAAYNKLRQPSEDVPVQYYSSYMPNLFDKILNQCVQPGQMCMKDMVLRQNVKDGRGTAEEREKHMKSEMPMKGQAEQKDQG